MSIRPFSLIRPNASREPSGDQRGRCSRFASLVTRTGLPPLTRPTYTSHWPPWFETYATCRPSGENDGCASTPATFVTALKRISARGRSSAPCDRARVSPATTTAAAARPQGIEPGKKARASAARRGRRRLDRPRALEQQPSVGDIAQPLAGVLAQAEAQHLAGARGCRPGQPAPVGIGSDDRGHHIGQAVPPEGAASAQHLVEHAPEGPDVGPAVDALAPRLLGAHVVRGADHPARRRRRMRGGCGGVVERRRTVIQDPGQAEVEQLHLAVAGQLDVGGLQVAVHDPSLVGGLEAQGDLARQRDRLRRRDRPARDAVGERLALDELHHDVVDVAGRADVVERADVRVLDGGDRARLAREPLALPGTVPSRPRSTFSATTRPRRVSRAR